ncbi:twin-arginine translocase TatA/TatE family subunit [Paenibacillus sp. P96]|uniref:Sec-independent protein translocase protein TatA n=1 Tax=Paenibacillus zeirhizosphaerae TaxID=2987519 RepID=A0ABT9FW09_9BACL|nr:twin-arginine translocase TatA/TatE family subunit [Paenibacillus sp. P96]MDP4098916.1 twin-arginine translocase TatA/TatE family subunit [Paenibacillus sp. P96]
MGFGGIGASGMILLAVLALLLFGPSKLPELGRAVGRTFREFKNGARDLMSEDESAAGNPSSTVRSSNGAVRTGEGRTTDQP